MNERIQFDPAALNEQQADGTACVICGTDITGPTVPIGHAAGGQVFCCISHVPDAARPTVPGSYPDGEPQSVRTAQDIAELLADASVYAELADRFASDGNDLMADAMDSITGALRYLQRAVNTGGDVDKGLEGVRKAIAQGRVAAATSRANERGDA